MSNKKFSEFTLQTDNSNVAFVVGFNGSDNVRISPSNLIGSGFLATSGGTMTGNLLLQDNIQLQVGTGADLKLYHNATDSFIENQTGILKIQSSVVDGDISFLADNGSGTATEYFRLDGGLGITLFSENVRWADNKYAYFGDSNDMQIRHAGTSAEISNYTGPLTIRNLADDQDIILQSDDGSGGTTEYFRLDGGIVRNVFSKNVGLEDNVQLIIGSGNDLQILHDASDTFLLNNTGDLYLRNLADDKDIIFQSDNGSGGTTDYLRLDGSDVRINVNATNGMQFMDNVKAKFGTSGDFTIHHDGTNSEVSNLTGNLNIKSTATDGDISFYADNGSGGTTEYFRVDGGATKVIASKNFAFTDNVRTEYGDSGDLQIYHNGTTNNIESINGKLRLIQTEDDGDISFESDDGSGGITEYFRLDGSLASGGELKTLFPDNSRIVFGDGADFNFYHDGTDSRIQNTTGHIRIINFADDSDIIFSSDDGSGGLATYFYLDGGNTRVQFNKNARFVDTAKVMLGTSDDLLIFHDSTDSHIENYTGNLNITNFADDKDIIFKSDDGSGGVAEYFRVDGGEERNIFSKDIKVLDNVFLNVGTSNDLQLVHDSSNTEINNNVGHLTIQNKADDSDIIFKSDDGSGGVTTYFKLDGSETNILFSKSARFIDSISVQLGTDADLTIQHDNTDGKIDNFTGDLKIRNFADDKDIIFQSDDGSGGVTEYFKLWGLISSILISKDVLIGNDTAKLKFGASQDLEIFHDGSDNFYNGTTGDMYFINKADDKDIIFQTDDGSGGLATYFTVDGANEVTSFQKHTKHEDSVVAYFGNGSDLSIQHNGSNTLITNNTGNILFTQNADDGDIIFYSDDGSGGTAQYFRVDGGAVETRFLKSTLHFDNVKAKFGDNGDLEIYHDGSNSYISDTGTGDLRILGETNIYIGAATGGANMAQFTKGGAVKLRFNDSNKFETTSSGVDVTGRMAINDGNDNVLIGDNAGDALSSGSANVAIGDNALSSEDGHGRNVAVGFQSLFAQNAGADAYNVAVGYQAGTVISTATETTIVGGLAGDALTTGQGNTAIGYRALSTEDTGGGNTAIGRDALMTQDTGNDAYNTAVGYSAGRAITTGSQNTIIGGLAGDALTIGKHNVAIGYESLSSANAGDFSVAIGHSALREQAGASAGDNFYNVAVGYQAGKQVTTGVQNTLIGGLAGDALTTGADNVAIGYAAMSTDDAGGRNVAVGKGALESQNGGDANVYNIGIGYHAGNSMTSGIYNTLLGGQAGDALTTGSSNVAIGLNALGAEDTGSDSIAIGRSALLNQNYDGSAYNVAIGRDAGKEVTTGIKNTLIGGLAGDSLTTGEKNVAVGYLALSNEDAYGFNTAVGVDALRDLNAGADAYNVAVGASAGATMSTGRYNNLIGAYAGDAITTGWSNTAIGYLALTTEDSGSDAVAIGRSALQNQNYNGSSYNIAIGRDAGKVITTGVSNTILGGQAGDALTTGSYSVAIGHLALGAEDTSGANVAIGYKALFVQDGGTNNTSVGYQSAMAITTGDENTVIGSEAGSSMTTATNCAVIGYNAEPSAAGAADEITLGDANVDTLRCATQTISSLSDERDKTNIQESTYGLDFIDQLNPVTFDWNTRDGSRKGKKDLGFIAQELDAVDDEYTQLVYKSNPDKLEASYGRLVPVLVKAIQELKQEIEQLKNK